MKIEYYKAKSLVRTGSVSLFSWAEAHLNPYQGCYHDCRYCDGKSENYHMHNDFGSRIRVKVNAPYLFEQFLKRKGFFPSHREKTSTLADFIPSIKEAAQKRAPGKFIIYIGGGVCDTYQPAEKEVKMTRRLLQIAYDYRIPVFTITKNTLVLRDLDLLKRINKNTYACVNFTITLADEEMQRIFEPRASSTQERFEAIRILRDAGIHSGVYFYPALPFIGATDENIQEIHKRAKQAKAEFVYCWGLTLKPGRNKQEFLKTLENHLPDLLPKYEALYGNNDKYGNLDVGQFKKFGLEWPEIKAYKYCYEYGLLYTAKRYIPEGRIKANLQVSEVLRKIGYLKSCLLQHPQSEVRPIYRAASYLENFQTDISQLEREHFNNLPIKKEVYPYIFEFLEEKKSRSLENLELQAYFASKKEKSE